MKNTLIVVIALLIVGGLAYFFLQSNNVQTPIETVPTVDTTTTPEVQQQPEVTPPVQEETVPPTEIIGTSAGDHDIVAYHYGSGDKEILFVGGIHGGYEWNTSLVAYQLMDYLKATPEAIPAGVKVTVIPVLNPDGLNKVIGTTDRFTRADIPTSLNATIPGRFNANTVDLNRNFDCDWQAKGTWQNTTVSGGGAAFSEPESQAIRDYVSAHAISAAIVWYSAAGGVYASNCHNGILPETTTLTDLYAKASGYKAYEEFDFYALTGDMVNWLAKKNIPAISVLLTTHEDTEWTKNLAGIKAILTHYAQ